MKGNQTFKKALLAFKIVFMIYLLLAFNAFVNGTKWMNLLGYVMAAWGALLCLAMLLQYKRYLKTANLWILLAFMVSYAISAGLHLSYGVSENLKGMVWLVVPIFVNYIAMAEYQREELRKELKLLAWIYVACVAIADVISVTMVYWGRALDFKDELGVVHAIGFRGGRLWGIYDDPNHGASITVAAVFLGCYLWSASRKIWKKVLLGSAVAVNYLYIVLSDSRTGLISLLAGIGVWLVLWYIRHGVRGTKKVTAVILAAILVTGGIYGVSTLMKHGYKQIDQKIAAIETKKHQGTKQEGSGIGRKKDLAKDVSNGRLAIWSDGLTIVGQSPVVGIGFRNIAGYAQEHLPDSYLVKNEQGITYDSMHNLELDVLVSQGILGILLFVLLLGNTVRVLIRALPALRKKDHREMETTFILLLSLGVVSTFLSILFYVNTPQGFVFWWGYGCLMRYMQIAVEAKECV